MRQIIYTAPRLYVAAMIILVAGCASRPGPETLDIAMTTPATERVVDIHVATTRLALARNSAIFGEGRAPWTSYARYQVSVPPTHEAGRIELPKGHPDPATDFAVMDRHRISHAEFANGIASGPGRVNSAAVFVHGYNQNFQEAVFRLAQMATDSGGSASSVLFTWPSEAHILSYVSDRDSAAYSRDALANLLTRLGQDPRLDEVTVLAHSMGSWLTVEALRQLSLAGKDSVLGRLHIVLVAPDIDLDVFQAQMRSMRPMAAPMQVLVSPDDRALRASQRLSGGRPRVGAIEVSDPRMTTLARETGVAIVDISDVATSDRYRHRRYANLPALVASLSQDDRDKFGNDLRRAGAYIFNVLGGALTTPFQITGAG